MPLPVPAQFTTADATLSGAINSQNLAFSFVPLPRLLLYQERAAQQGSLVWRNGVLVTEFLDYVGGPGWYLLATSLNGLGN